MSELYPLKFEPILKEKIWGGSTLIKHFNKKPVGSDNLGESWELSALQENQSVIANGFLAGNNIEEVIEVYMGDITGDAVFEKFGSEFPLLIKFLEAREDLSVQVHPGNEIAKERHLAYGKTEMLYILESNENSRIYTGFKDGVTKEIYEEAIIKNNLPDLLNIEKPEAGDMFFIPAGRIHAIGAGTVLVEVEQTSDITYRIFDWNRKSVNNETRELHTDLALDVVDFTATGENKVKIKPELNITESLVNCEFFNANIIRFNKSLSKDYNFIDSFVIYICTEGEFHIKWDNNSDKVSKGETVLLPAMIKEVVLEPLGEAQVLEIYIETESR